MLISCESYCVYTFTETYSLDLQNPRFVKLKAYLQKLFSKDELDVEENLTPTFEKIKLSWEFLGGYAYPIIVDREYLYNPFKENEFTNKIDEIFRRSRDMFEKSQMNSSLCIDDQDKKSPKDEKKLSRVQTKIDEEADSFDADSGSSENVILSLISDVKEI